MLSDSFFELIIPMVGEMASSEALHVLIGAMGRF